MSLPAELSSIFRSKQKSYKMVLILSILDEYQVTNNQIISLDSVARRFLTYYQSSIADGKRVDEPPSGVAASWSDFSLSKTRSLLYTPIKALSSILEESDGGQKISFKSVIWDKLDENMINELHRYAIAELENYNNNLATTISLKQSLIQIMSSYTSAKTQPFSNHPLGELLRQTLPAIIKKLPFIDKRYKVQGSIGQGNWANIPWLAILDKRITETTQHGEYVVYLFAEDMSSVYLTLAQGVTLPLREGGRRDGYLYLEQKVREMRELLPLDNMQKDEYIHLTSSGLGRDYQVSTVAYIRYERDHIPDDDRLITDLDNMIVNYKLYAETVTTQNVESRPIFKYTVAHLYLAQGIIYYLGKELPTPIDVEELAANQSMVLISGDDVKHPRERIQHIGRALLELGLVNIENGHYSLTSLGIHYFNAFDSNTWRLSSGQANLLREKLANDESSDGSSNLIKIINIAISIVQQLNEFSFETFNEKFINVMRMQEEWGKVIQENRSRFMLNWLEELLFIQKSGDKYIFQGDKENEPLDAVTVPERIDYIKAFTKQRGFHYPDSLIENLYLSFKTKPFVILAGVSGTGKTKLVKLFAEALGATSNNKQFSLIPVRPDWSDSSDLLGYKDLSGKFRPGQLTEVLVEATKTENRQKSYFICLDEMNLARVEHYFSDLLSIIETQEWQNSRIVTAPLIYSETLSLEDQQVYGNLTLPDNVYLVGTVNMDETTHPFSKKVLDRANTIEFNHINLGQFPEFGASSLHDKGIKKVDNTFLRSEYLQLVDVYQDHRALVHRTTEKLVKINGILEEIHSHVGFRIRDAVCFYMIYNERFQLLSEDVAFDQQLLQKILPRVQGSSSSVKHVLLQLMQGALGKTLPISELMDDASDLYMRWNATHTAEAAKHPQTARKIAFMIRRLEEDGFTSFWLS